MNETEVVQAYKAAWNEDDKSRRSQLLETSMIESGSFVSPLGEHVGRDAVSNLIGRFRRRSPGESFDITSAVDAHHNVMRFRWEVRATDGSVIAIGIQFAEAAEDGRLSRVVAFFGPSPAPGVASSGGPAST